MSGDAPTPLAGLLREQIRAEGAITFHEFMERALYDPAHGFYTSGRARIGKAGDFFTNVSVGPLFGTLLARQFVEVWERLVRPREFTIVEQGAHRGDFARDALAGLRRLAPACAEAARYVIVEPVAHLRAVQEGALASGWVTCVPSLDELPPFTGVHFSNELLDAFPVHLVRWGGAQWAEQYVALHGEELAFVSGPLSTKALHAPLATLENLPAGYTTEVSLAAPQWARDVAGKLERGVVLAIDYGFARPEFYASERTAGTLRAYRGHRVEPNPLTTPGEIDLTAHVEFTSIAEAAESAGLGLHGFTDQHHFFVGLGSAHFPDGIVPRPAEMREFTTLMHPGMLGLSFKVLALARGLTGSHPLSGFSFGGDPRRQLGCSLQREK